MTAGFDSGVRRFHGLVCRIQIKQRSDGGWFQRHIWLRGGGDVWAEEWIPCFGTDYTVEKLNRRVALPPGEKPGPPPTWRRVKDLAKAAKDWGEPVDSAMKEV